MREGWSFDGHEYRKWAQSRHGTELPPLDQAEVDPRDRTIGPLTGSVSATLGSQDNFNAYAHGSGLVYLPPFRFHCFDRETRRMLWPLSELLRKRPDAGKQILITELPDATWQIEIPDAFDENQRNLYFLDPARGFVITGAEYYHMQTVYSRLTTTIEQVADDVWVPVDVIQYNVFDGSADRIVLSDIEVNPELADEDFRVLFPVGAQIQNSVEEQ